MNPNPHQHNQPATNQSQATAQDVAHLRPWLVPVSQCDDELVQATLALVSHGTQSLGCPVGPGQQPWTASDQAELEAVMTRLFIGPKAD